MEDVHSMRNEKTPGCLGYIGDEVLLSFMGIVMSQEIRIPMISTDPEVTSQISMLPMRKMPSAMVSEVGVKVLVFRRRGVGWEEHGGTPWKMNGWNLRFSPVLIRDII